MKEFNFNIHHEDLWPNRKTENISSYQERPTVKILLKDNNNICLTTSSDSGFYFLPGGGIENNETQKQALQRECIEETGFNVSIKEKIGTVIEYRNESKEKREVHYYKGFIAGISTTSNNDEVFKVKWAQIDEAISILQNQYKSINDKTDNFYTRKFNTYRDLKVLQQVGKIF